MVCGTPCLGYYYTRCGVVKYQLKLGICGAHVQVSFLGKGMRKCSQKPYIGDDLSIK